jgi:hypothetical protein
VELVARVDVELGEDLVQVVLDGAAADEQPGADLGVRETVAGQERDLGLLSGELVAGLDGAFADALAAVIVGLSLLLLVFRLQRRLEER